MQRLARVAFVFCTLGVFADVTPMTIEIARKDGPVLARTYPVSIDYQDLRVKLTSPEYRNNFYPGPGFAPQTLTLPEGGGDFSFDTRGFAVELQAADDRHEITLSLEKPREDVSCSYYHDVGCGPEPLAVNGSASEAHPL